VDSSVQNISDICVVCSVISKTITNNSSVVNCVHQTFPSYRKKEQWLQKLNENEWLMIQSRKRGCKMCHEVGSLGIHKTQGLKSSTEHKECSVSSFYDNDKK
jgi:hypothetical protein